MMEETVRSCALHDIALMPMRILILRFASSWGFANGLVTVVVLVPIISNELENVTCYLSMES